MKSQSVAVLFHCTSLFCVFFYVFYETKSGMIENQMVNFEPGEYMRKEGFSVSDTGGSEEKI